MMILQNIRDFERLQNAITIDVNIFKIVVIQIIKNILSNTT